MIKKEKFIITGSSGFIGMSLCLKLLSKGHQVLGIDNMNDYYSIALKEARLENLLKYENFNFRNENILDLRMMEKIFKEFSPSKVINLAAQAGVRYSLKNPHVYINSNVNGFMNILECCRIYKVQTLVYASSSSVYGGNIKTPFSEKDRVDSPVSIYASTKKMNELMAYTYSHLYNLRTTGLRFFTVYGPWGRPDMAIYTFVNKIIKSEKITVFNHGDMGRDFTYIDDIINGVLSSIDKNYFCEVFNLGNSKPENIMSMIKILESILNTKAKIDFDDMQLGDVPITFADITLAKEKLDYQPKTSLDEGALKFINWFKDYKNLSN